MAEESYTFGLVHGAWHGAWCWQFVQKELQEAGQSSFAMDLPIDDPDANFDDYAAVAQEAAGGDTDIIWVGHSRAGNVLPRLVGRSLIFLSTSFEPATSDCLVGPNEPALPPRNSQAFMRGIRPLEGNLTTYDPVVARQVFYPDASVARSTWASNKLRPQRRSNDEPRLEAWPDTPKHYIVCKDDCVVMPPWQRQVARRWLKVEPVNIPGDHSPFLNRPRQLSRLLIHLAGLSDAKPTA